MQRTKIHVLFFTTVLLVGAVGVFALAFFLQQNVTYEIKFQDNLNTKNVQINGLMKTYSLEPRNDGTIAEIEEYVMTKDAVEIALDVPKDISEYDSVIIEAEFENPDSPTLEACLREQQDIVLNEPVFDWTCHALDHQYLNHFQEYLGENWVSLSDEKLGLTLLQKTRDDEAGKAGKQYASVQEFLENPPEKKEVEVTEINEFGQPTNRKKFVAQTATEDYKLPQKYIFPKEELPLRTEETTPIMQVGVPMGYEEENHELIGSNVTRIPYSFRGNLTISALTDSDLKIHFDKQDLNIYEGEDIYEIKISDQNDILFSDIITDDGDTGSGRTTTLQTYEHTIIREAEDTLPKMYTIELQYRGSGSDSVIRNLFLNTKYVQLNNMHIVDRSNEIANNIVTKPITLYSLPGEITVKAAHDYSEQNILVNREVEKVSSLNATHIFLEKSENEIYIAENDLLVSSEKNGFSITPDGIFETDPNATIPFDITNIDHISYIITPYQKGKVEFKIKKSTMLEKNGKKLTIRLSANSLEGYRSAITIKNLRIILRGKDITPKKNGS